MSLKKNARAMLIILDGFGIGKDSPFNAIQNAKMPFYQKLLSTYPHSQLLTHGVAVGLPDGVMGNSEVGHTTMGAGRIVYQDLTRISQAIYDRSFFQNPVIRNTLECGAKTTGRVHLMGLLSDGGVHSHIEHLQALLDLCLEMRIPRVSVHVFLDGRDTPPTSGVSYLEKLLKHSAFQPLLPKSQKNAHSTQTTLASVMGRYWAMDRDKRWERVAKAYLAITGQIAPAQDFKNRPDIQSIKMQESSAAIHLVERSYQIGKTDEFVEPFLLSSEATICEGDSVFFFNFRADRAREMTEALTAKEFSFFDRGLAPKLSAFAGMTKYNRQSSLPAAFLPQNLNHIFGEWLVERKLSQFRIAETEKYAHVTFFFNGGHENPFPGEERVLVPSPKEVPTYDLKPEMSAFQVAAEAVKRIKQGQYDFILMNFANADMVGHTGNYEAAVKAMEALDQCLEKVIGTAEKFGYHILLTADHGNAEEMRDKQGQIHTQHTLNPVPAIWIAPGTAIAPRQARKVMRDGGLQDIMPTLCDLMGLPIPQEVSGKSLIHSV